MVRLFCFAMIQMHVAPRDATPYSHTHVTVITTHIIPCNVSVDRDPTINKHKTVCMHRDLLQGSSSWGKSNSVSFFNMVQIFS